MGSWQRHFQVGVWDRVEGVLPSPRNGELPGDEGRADVFAGARLFV